MPTPLERTHTARHHETVFPRHAALKSRRTALRHLRAVALVTTLLGSVLAGSSMQVGAQNDDGTGAAIPGPPSECVIPRSAIDLSATPTPAPPPGRPPATARRTANASAAASPVATAEATAAPATPTGDPLTEELLSASTTITSCLTERNVETFTMITTDLYRGQQFGSDAPISAEVYAQLAPTLLPLEYQVVELRDISIVDPSTVTTSVTYTVAYQQRSSVWTFQQDRVDGLLAWVLASEEAAPARIPDGASSLDVAIRDNAYTFSGDATADSTVALNLTNLDGEDHEALVLKLPEGTGTDVLLRNPGPALPEGVAFIGQSTVAAGTEGVLVLTDLPKGTYTIVCLLPDEDGLPYLSSGMETTFTVT